MTGIRRTRRGGRSTARTILGHLAVVVVTTLMVTSVVAGGALVGATAAPADATGDGTTPTPAASPGDAVAAPAPLRPSEPTAPATRQQAIAGTTATASDSTEDAVEAPDAKQVTLVTGQTVTVTRRANGERVYRVDAPGEVYRLNTPDGTYVIPHDANLSVYDPALFNVDLLIEQNLTDAATDQIPVIIERADVADNDDGDFHITDREDIRGYEDRRTLDSIGAEAGTIAKADASTVLDSLWSEYEITGVHLDRRYEVALDTAVDAINATQARATHEVNGSGVTVAVLDTGVDADHPDLQDAVINQTDMTGDGIGDPHGHGTHVAGTIAGDGNASNGTYVGVAPGASIMDVRVLGDDGFGRESDIIAGMHHATEHGADIISMSLGGPETPGDPFIDAVNAQVQEGVIVIAAAGNAGPDYRTVGSPGSVLNALTVGAYDAQADEMATFSSRGPTLQDYVKPDIVAPGVDITAADAGTDGYTTLSGTSMATPIVSGTVALLYDEKPGMTVNRTRDVLLSSADPLDGYDVYTQGSGFLNASRSLAPDLVITNATHSLGTIGQNTTINRTVTVTNTGETSRSLNLSTSLTSLEPAADYSDRLMVNRSNVTLGVNETQAITITTNTSVATGTYGGSIVIEPGDGDHQHSVPIGFTRAEEVTVAKYPVDAEDTVEGDQVVLLEPGFAPTIRNVTNGTATFTVRSDSYAVISGGEDDGANDTPILTYAEGTASDETIQLLENETVPYALNDSALAHELDTVGLHFAATATIADEPIAVGEYFAHHGTVRLSPAPGLNASVQRVAAPTSQHDGGDHVDVDDVYILSQVTHGVDGAHNITPDPATLTTENRTYYRTAQGEQLTIAIAPELGLDATAPFMGPALDLDDRQAQQIRTNPGAGYFADVRTADGVAWVDRLDLPPGETASLSVNRRPLTGDLAVETSNDSIAVAGSAASDQSRVIRNPFQGEGAIYEASIRVNGQPVENTTTAAPYIGLDANHTMQDGDPVRAVYTAHLPNSTISPTVTTVINVAHNASGTTTHPEIVGVDLPVAPNNTVTEDQVTFPVIVESAEPLTASNLTIATAPASADASPPPWIDGASDAWEPAANVTPLAYNQSQSVGIYDVTLDLSAYADPPHLAIRARADDGDTFGTLVEHAFAVTAPPASDEEVIAGQLTLANGSPAAGHGVIVNRRDTGEWLYEIGRTDAQGNFSVGVEPGGHYDLTYIQADPADLADDPFPRDGNADIVPIASIDLSGDGTSTFADPTLAADADAVPDPLGPAQTDGIAMGAAVTNTTDPALGAITLPAGHVLDVAVEDWNGEPVSGAITHYGPMAATDFFGVRWETVTNAAGLAQAERRDGPGLEVNGSVRVTTVPPRQPAYAPEQYNATLDVNASYTHNVTLAARDVVRVPEDYATIQAAVNAANDTARIIVDAGTYAEDVIVNKSVAIVSAAANASNATLGAPENAPVLAGNGSRTAAFSILGVDDVFIQGFAIRNYTEVGIGSQGVATGAVTVRENTITAVDLGIGLDGVDDPQAHSEDWLVERNVIDAPRTGGIHLWNAGRAAVRNNHAIGNATVAGSSANHNGTVVGVQVGSANVSTEISILGNQLNGSYESAGILAGTENGDLAGAIAANTLNGSYGNLGVQITSEGTNGSVGGLEVASNWITDAAFAAILVDPSAGTTPIEHVAIVDNDIDTSGIGVGVARQPGTGGIGLIEVRDNAMTGVGTGVYALAEADIGKLEVVQNAINASDAGIAVESINGSAVPVSVAGGDIHHATVGLGASGAGAQIDANSVAIFGNHDGVYAEQNASIAVTDASVFENDVGLNASRDAFIAAHGSAIVDNADFGARVVNGSAWINATNNYWGHQSGPGGNATDPVTGTRADGSGDNVSERVRFDPWLDALAAELHVPEDFGSIQAAVDAADPGDTIVVAEGTYNESVEVDKSVQIVGEAYYENGSDGVGAPAGSPVLNGTDDRYYAFDIHENVTDVAIRGLAFRDYNHSVRAWNQGTAAIDIEHNTFVSVNNSVLVGGDPRIDDIGVGLHEDWHIEHNRIVDPGFVGLSLTNLNASDVRDNEIVENRNHTEGPGSWGIAVTAWGIDAGDVEVRNNVVTGPLTEAGINVGGANATVHDVVVDGNTIVGPQHGIDVSSRPILGATWSATEAVALLDNDINATTDAAVEIVADGANTSIQSVLVEDNRLAESRYGLYGHATNGGVAGGITVRHNTFHENDQSGLAFEDVQFVSIVDNVVVGPSTLGGSLSTGTIGSGPPDLFGVNAGIAVLSSATDVAGVHVKRNQINGTLASGISLLATDNASLTNATVGGNHIDADAAAGVAAVSWNATNGSTTLDDLRVANNDITQTTEAGIAIENAGSAAETTNVTVVNNYVWNASTGVRLATPDAGAGPIEDISIVDNVLPMNDKGLVIDSTAAVSASLRNNKISGSGLVGARIEGAGVDVSARRNRFTDGPIGLLVRRNATVQTELNHFVGNSDYGVLAENTTVTVNATENWWGDASGPGGNVTDPVTGAVANGTGDNVSEHVLFDPWLESIGPPALPGQDNAPQDLDGDGRYEDVIGNNRVSFTDAVVLAHHLDSDAVQNHTAAFDFDASGAVTFDDVIELVHRAAQPTYLESGAVGPEVAAASSAPTVRVENASVGVGEFATVNVTLQNVSAGVSGYAFNVTSEAPVSFVDVIPVGIQNSSSIVEISMSGDRVGATVFDLADEVTNGTGEVVLFRIGLEGESAGEANLTLERQTIDGEHAGTVNIDDDVGAPILPNLSDGVAVVTDVAVETGEVTGTVTDADNGTPIPGADVALVDPSDGSVHNATTTGPDGNYSILAAPGTYTLGVDATGYQTTTFTNVEVFENATTEIDVPLHPEETTAPGDGGGVLNASVQHLSGTAPDMDNITLDAFLAGGLLQLQLVNDTAPSTDTELRYELAGLGADATTAFEIEAQVENMTPRVLIGAGNVSEWSVTNNSDGTANVSLTVRPVAVQSLFDCQAWDGCTPPRGQWPTGQDDQATESQAATVSLAADSLEVFSADKREALTGAILTTDAQKFGSPQYTPPGAGQPPELSLYVAGPHLTTAGNQNEGFYTALLPQALLDAWNVTNPEAQLTAAFGGNATGFSVDETPDGDVWIDVDLHYSEGDVTITTEETTPTLAIQNTSVAAGHTAVANVTIDQAPNGVSSASLNVTAGSGVVFEGVQAADLSLNASDGGSVTVTNGSVNVTGVDANGSVAAGASDIVLLRIELAGTSVGNTSLALEPGSIDIRDDANDPIAPNLTDAVATVIAPPNAALTADPSTIAPMDELVTLDASNSTGEIVEYRWDFGDGSQVLVTNDSTVETPYDSTGTYEVTVTVVDRLGNTDNASVTITVEEDAQDSPTPGFGPIAALIAALLAALGARRFTE